MAGVQDGQDVSAAVTNPAFLIKNADDTTPSRLGLGSTASDQGPSITWTQQQINSVLSLVGLTRNLAYNAVPTWVNNYVGAINDTIFARVAALVALFSGSTGHTHSGTDGQGPKVAASSLASIANNTVLGNTSGSSASPTALSLSASAGASTVMYRDANKNTAVNNLNEGFATTATAAGTTTLTVASAYTQQFTGTLAQNCKLPDATTLPQGFAFMICNRSTGQVSLQNNGATLLQLMTTNSQAVVTLADNSTANGVWDIAYSSANASGGGGGGSLLWSEISNPPTPVFENGMMVYAFQVGQTLNCVVRVPSGYIAGNPVKLRLPFYDPDSSGTVLLQTVATLIRTGVDAVTSTTNQRTSTNSAVTLGAGTVNIPQAVTLDLTDSTGKVNGVAISGGDSLLVALTRATGTAVSDVKAMAYDSEVTFS